MSPWPDRGTRHRDAGWRLFVRTALARAYPRIIGANRERAWIVFEILLPLVALSAYVFVYRGLNAPDAFVGFVILGGAMTAFWLNVMWAMSSQLFWEKETGNLALYVMAPAPMMAILLGMALGGMFNGTIRALVVLTIGASMFGVGFAVDRPLLLLAVFWLTLTALYGMGMMFASLFLLLGREAWHLVNLAQEPAYFLSGTYFPVKSFPAWVATAASIIPLTLGLDAMRQLVFEGDAAAGLFSVRTEAAALAVLGIAFVAGARASLADMERLAIVEGRLTRSGG